MTVMIDKAAPTGGRARTPWARWLRAALAGIIAAAVALGVAELLAGLIGPNSSPVVVVGGSVIDATPRPVKDFAIGTFGSNDKLALVIGTLVLIALFAIALGLLSLRDRRIGAAGIVVLGLVGAVAAVTRPTGSILDAVPSVVGAAVGILAILVLTVPLTLAGPAKTGTENPARADEMGTDGAAGHGTAGIHPQRRTGKPARPARLPAGR